METINVLLALLPIVFYSSTLVLLLWAFIDIAKRKIANKALWVVVILGIPVIGPLGYLIAGRKDAQ